MGASLLLLVLVLALFLVGLRQLLVADREHRRLLAAVLAEESGTRSLFRWTVLDRLVRRAPYGSRLANVLESAGVTLSPGRFVGMTLVVCTLLTLVLGSAFSWLLVPVGIAVGVFAARLYVRRARVRRREAFVAQMPELARILSNATEAGLSIRTAVALAADDLAEPAAAELRAVTEQMNLGASLQEALNLLEARLPSREVSILIGTLVVSSRAGGKLVGALRDIADTLETRKETRREVQTTYAEVVSTANIMTLVGVAMLFLLNQLNEGTVDAMLRSPVGQVALFVAGGMYALGLFIIRRMTRVVV